jgi:Protein of unknown function (DUF2917)
MTPTPSSQSTTRLATGQLLSLPDACGTRIECLHGALWITIDNDPRDVLLDAGQAHTLESDSRAIVQPILGSALLRATREHAPCARPARHGARAWLQAMRARWSWNVAGAL